MKTWMIDPTTLDPHSMHRGGGRFVSLLKEYIPQLESISDIGKIDSNDTLLVPFFNPFTPPYLNKRVAHKQILLIYDAIPLKYPSHFPVGIKGGINVWRNKQSFSNFDTLVTISNAAKHDLIRYLGIPEQKIVVIYPTLSQSFLDAQLTNKNTLNSKYGVPSTYLIYVADVNWNKNIANIARAIKLAGIPCVFVGKAFEKLKHVDFIPGGTLELTHPWQKEFREFIKEVDDTHFIFPGYVSDSELKTLYQNALANVLVSRDEGFGFSYLEASSQGTPSILSDSPIFHEIASDGCLFARPENPEDIAAKIKEIQDTSVRNKIISKLTDRVHFFLSDKFISSWNEVLRS